WHIGCTEAWHRFEACVCTGHMYDTELRTHPVAAAPRAAQRFERREPDRGGNRAAAPRSPDLLDRRLRIDVLGLSRARERRQPGLALRRDEPVDAGPVESRNVHDAARLDQD